MIILTTHNRNAVESGHMIWFCVPQKGKGYYPKKTISFPVFLWEHYLKCRTFLPLFSSLNSTTLHKTSANSIHNTQFIAYSKSLLNSRETKEHLINKLNIINSNSALYNLINISFENLPVAKAEAFSQQEWFYRSINIKP